MLVAPYRAAAFVAAAKSARFVGRPTTAPAIAPIAQTTTTASPRGNWDTISGDEVAVVAVHSVIGGAIVGGCGAAASVIVHVAL